MIIEDSFDQGTIEWLVARLGRPTASCFGSIVTSTGKKATGQSGYINQLVAERVLEEPLDGFQSLEMFQGKANEGESRATYQLLTGSEVTEVALIYPDEDQLVAASPDGLIQGAGGWVGGLELKNVQAKAQVEYIRGGVVPTKYKPQVYGSLYISGLEYWDFMSCSIGFKPLLVRTHLYDKGYCAYAAKLDEYLPPFLEALDEAEKLVRE